MYLLDVNVWLALAFDTHIHHSTAKSWHANRTNEQCFFCRMTQQGFLRLSTNPKVFPADAVSMNNAWQMYDTILSDPQISFVDEPPSLETHWRAFTQSELFSNKVWNDAYLAAFALAANHTLVTFDRGFAKYQNVACVILP